MTALRMRSVFCLLAAGVILLAASSRALAAQPTQPAQSAPQASAAGSAGGAAELDDDDRVELLEHWDNAKYSRDQRRQIAGIAVFLSAAGAAAMLRSRNRLARVSAHRSAAGGQP